MLSVRLPTSSSASTGIRNRALIGLLWRTGLRISESLDVREKDIDLPSGTVVVQRGKGSKRRTVGIDDGVRELLGTWLERRRALALPEASPLFCTLRGESIDTSYIRHLLPRLARKAGIRKRVHAHGLQHRFAVDLVNEGASITTVRDLLGHSSIAVTDTYLRRVGAGEAVAFGQSRTWRFE